MRSIYKKELRAYLTSMTGYIFMAVLLAVTSLYYVANCLVGGYPVFGAILSSVYFILLLVVPVLTMRSMAEEKRQKTDQLLMTAPVSLWAIVWGKYLAMVTIFLIPMAILCLYPLILLQFGTVSLLMAYTAVLGFVLFGAACLAIGLFLSAVTESQVIAAVLTFGVLFFLNMASGIANVIGASGIAASIFNALCIYQPFINFVQGIFDLTGVLYYLTVILLALFLTVQLLQKKHGTYRVSMVVFACIAAVLVNLIGNKLPSQYRKADVSSQKLFTTGEQTEEIVGSLDEDVTIYLIAQQGSEDATLQELLERYEGLSSHIKVETKDPVLYPNFVSQYTGESLSENSILVVGQERSKAIDYYDIYQYSMDYSTYESSLSSFDGEGQITSAIAYVTTDEMPVVYTLTGHDEAELSTTLISSIEKENIALESLSLLTEETVPEDAKAVIVYGALSDISEDEKTKLEAYMEQGGQVVILLGYTDQDTPNLDSLLSNYGISLASGLVLEGDSQHYIPNYPYYLLPNVQSTEFTSDVTSRYILMAFAQGMSEAADLSEDLTYESLLTTSSSAYSKSNIESDSLDREEDDAAGPFDLGAVVTKTIDDDTRAKLVVFSSETLLDEQVDSMVSGGNSSLFLNVMSALVDHESTVSIEAKNISTEYLTVSAGSAVFWGILTIVLIPLALLITGGIIWFRRRKR